MDIRVVFSDSLDPFVNLAIEEGIFQQWRPGQKVLYLWRNNPCVVLGRFQNPWKECDTKKMSHAGVELVRRQSGGGTVYHDPNNLCFTFFDSKVELNKRENLELIVTAMRGLGVSLEINHRHDILMKTQRGLCKVSGSAFKEKKDRAFHHGTLLISSDLNKLTEYLSPEKRNLQGKGIDSVRSMVANINEQNIDLDFDKVRSAITKEFFTKYGKTVTIENLGLKFLRTFEQLKCEHLKLKNWQWRYGETPRFNHKLEHQFDWGQFEIRLDSIKGVITEAQINSDAFHPEMMSEVARSLTNKTYNKEGVSMAIEEVKKELPMINDYLNEVGSWLSSSIQ